MEQIDAYYDYAIRIRKTLNGYMNLTKLETVWNNHHSADKAMLHRIFLQLSYYYLTHMCVCVLLTSRKMNRNIIKEHLTTRRMLISVLRNIRSRFI